MSDISTNNNFPSRKESQEIASCPCERCSVIYEMSRLQSLLERMPQDRFRALNPSSVFVLVTCGAIGLVKNSLYQLGCQYENDDSNLEDEIPF